MLIDEGRPFSCGPCTVENLRRQVPNLSPLLLAKVTAAALEKRQVAPSVRDLVAIRGVSD